MRTRLVCHITAHYEKGHDPPGNAETQALRSENQCPIAAFHIRVFCIFPVLHCSRNGPLLGHLSEMMEVSIRAVICPIISILRARTRGLVDRQSDGRTKSLAKVSTSPRSDPLTGDYDLVVVTEADCAPSRGIVVRFALVCPPVGD